MIKKLNFALLCAAAAILLVKLFGTQDERVAEPPSDDPVVSAVAEEISELAPNLYYLSWYPFARENVVSHRDGFCIDQLQAVFPKIRLVNVTGPDEMESFFAAMTNDARSVFLVAGGAMLQGRAQIVKPPLGYIEIRILSSRASPWRWAGEESLASREVYCDEIAGGIPLSERLRKAGRLHVIDVDKVDLVKVLNDNPNAVYIQPCSSNWREDISNTGNYTIERFRLSPVVEKVDLHVAVNTLDPAFAEAFAKDFAAGMSRISKAGIRRRIMDYYFHLGK